MAANRTTEQTLAKLDVIAGLSQSTEVQQLVKVLKEYIQAENQGELGFKAKAKGAK